MWVKSKKGLCLVAVYRSSVCLMWRSAHSSSYDRKAEADVHLLTSSLSQSVKAAALLGGISGAFWYHQHRNITCIR